MVNCTVANLKLSWKVLTISAAEGLILEAPTDQTVPVNSTAMFSCRVTGFLVWRFNGLEITSMRQDGFCSTRGVCVNGTLDDSPDETESLLLVAAIEENNNSTIQCLASETDISTPEESDIVILKIFGKFVMLRCIKFVVICFPYIYRSS